MHILITGGSGFIGQALSIALLEQGHTLSVLSRNPLKTQSIFGSYSVNVIQSLKHLVGNIDVVVNLAGAAIADKRWTNQRKNELLNSRLCITQDIVNLINSGIINPKVFISGSAVGFYGDTGDMIIDEYSSYFHPEFSHDLCKAWEDAANEAKNKTRVCILRTGVVLDRDGGALKKMLLPFQLGLGGRLGTGKQWFSWIHREDLVGMIIFLIENEKCDGVYNGTAPNPVTNREFTCALGVALNRPTLFAMPGILLKILMGNMSELLLNGQRVLPKNALNAGFKFKYPTIGMALKSIFE